MEVWRVEVFSKDLMKWIPYGFHDYASFHDANVVSEKLQSVGYKVRISRKDV